MDEQQVKLKCLETALYVYGHGTADPKTILDGAKQFYEWFKGPGDPEYKPYTGYEMLKVV